MNKRQKKKRITKLRRTVAERIKADPYYSYCQCDSCIYYENDREVGLVGCVAPALYDKDDEIIPKVDDMVTIYMGLGIGCPFYR